MMLGRDPFSLAITWLLTSRNRIVTSSGAQGRSLTAFSGLDLLRQLAGVGVAPWRRTCSASVHPAPGDRDGLSARADRVPTVVDAEVQTRLDRLDRPAAGVDLIARPCGGHERGKAEHVQGRDVLRPRLRLITDPHPCAPEPRVALRYLTGQSEHHGVSEHPGG